VLDLNHITPIINIRMSEFSGKDFTPATSKKALEAKRAKNAILTSSCKESLAVVYEMLGGHVSFFEWAEDNKTEFYRLYTKLIPVEPKIEINVNNNYTDVLEAARKRVSTTIDSTCEPVISNDAGESDGQ